VARPISAIPNGRIIPAVSTASARRKTREREVTTWEQKQQRERSFSALLPSLASVEIPTHPLLQQTGKLSRTVISTVNYSGSI
jgi:hypothetical protein